MPTELDSSPISFVVVLGLPGVRVEAAVLDVVDPRAEPLLDQPADQAELAREVRQAVRIDLPNWPLTNSLRVPSVLLASLSASSIFWRLV